ncbi:Carbohydrate-binding CenC domain protein [Candidatus Magnetomorum sp. HK-1]|nr:Carbohydrate-binding CenC domain protein [Candidatus Magnetomorum sp. HK-1]
MNAQQSNYYYQLFISKLCTTLMILFFSNPLTLFANTQDIPLTYIIVKERIPFASIEISKPHSDKMYQIALFFQTYIQKATGAKLPLTNEILSQNLDNYPVRIHLNIKLTSDNQFKDSNFDKSDGFTINLSKPNHIWITGNSVTGTEFGVYEFLERFVGIRWLFPGEIGEHIPKKQTLSIQSLPINQSPKFISRCLSGLYEKTSDQLQWARRNRMHSRIRFMHNLHKIFPIDPYLKTHPHLYPKKNGKVNIPYPTIGWQPCLQEPDAITIAVQHIAKFFKQNPSVNSFSLGSNDGISASSGYCISEEETRKINDWGYADVSDHYFNWANHVVSSVLKTHPDKFFGTLAYMELAAPPQKIQPHDNIITFLTEDRLRWVDKSCQLSAKKLTENWTNSTKRIGFYDYIYGSPYLLPRVYFHHMADVYKYAAKQGVWGVYAEAYPNWGEGPKLYLTLKLFWNPFVNVDKLLKDWYLCCVGEKAAPYLEAYYDIWEKFWTNKIQDTPWFKNKAMYMAFWSPKYLDVADISDIQKSRHLLEQTLKHTETDIQKKRAQLFLKTFEYYEASAISYWGLVKKSHNIKKIVANQMNKKRYILLDQFESNPLLHHPLRFDSNYRFPNLIFNK